MMDEPEIQGEGAPSPPADVRKRKYPWAMIIVIFLFVLIPFLSWYGSWFGRPLSDSQMEAYLTDREKPRNVQHALSFIGNQIIEKDPSMKRWYPLVVEASHNPAPEVRRVAAWTMGQDNTSEEFHQGLLAMLKDENAGVRHNAALQLIRFNDASGRAELRAMLEPVTITADRDGTVEFVVSEEGTPVGANSPLIRLKEAGGQTVVIRAGEDARIQTLIAANNSSVKSGEALMILSPSVEQAFESLKGLFIIGEQEDIPAVQRYTGHTPGMSDAVQKQALSTLQAIRARAAKQ